LPIVGLQIGLRLLNLTTNLLQLAVVFLKAIKFYLFGSQSLFSIFVLMQQLFLVSDGLVTLIEIAL